MRPESQPSTVSAQSEIPDHFLQDTSNGQLAIRLKKEVESAKSYWEGSNDGKRKLSEARKRNYSWWLGNHYEGITLYDHNIPYTNNRIYVSVEMSIRVAVARIAYANILPGSEKQTSQQFATDLEKSLQRIAQKRKLKSKMQISARHLLTKYVGILEPVYDGSLGKGGDIDFRVLDPEKVTVSEKGGLFDEPPMVSVEREATAKELVLKFPHKETEIRTKFSLLENDEAFQHDTEQRVYKEVWFDDYDEDDNKVVRCAFYLGENFDIELGIIENPHWLPEDDPNGVRNFFEQQRKPFIFINYQNSGKNKIDDNAAIDQQIPLNRVLNKRGRQIAENADDASGGLIYNSKMISKDDMAMLIGASDEKIGVNGDVRAAVARSAPPLLPNYVVEDKVDARNQIDEMGATTPATRNAQSSYGTLGEAVLQTQQDTTRQDGLSEAAETAYLECYEWTLQLMKVWYTEEKMIQVRGEDGKFDYAMISSDKIEDGTDIQIVPGSSAPLNKEKNRQDVAKFLEQGIVDPLTVFEVSQSGEMPSPQRMVERLVKWNEDKQSYKSASTTEEFDRNAQVDIELIKRGVVPDEREEITSEYLDTIINFITSGTFLSLTDDIQMALTQWLDNCKTKAAKMLQLREGLITDVSQTMAAAMPVQVDPTRVDPNVSPPPGAPPPEMIAELTAKGLIDANGQPTQAPVAPVAPAQTAPVSPTMPMPPM